MNFLEQINKVNERLEAGEPDNISVDDFMGYVGYRPQAIIDAMNAELWGQWGFEELSSEIVNTDKGQLAVSNCRVWLSGIDFKPTSWGQSNVTRGAVGDARKGAQTDALKKGLSYFGIGNRAYHGLLENPKESKNGATKKPTPQPTRPATNGTSQPPTQNKTPQVKVEEIPTVDALKAEAKALNLLWDRVVTRACPDNFREVLSGNISEENRKQISGVIQTVKAKKGEQAA